MVVMVIPWSTWTWRTHVDHYREQILTHTRRLAEARRDLERSERELKMAERMDVADEPLPEDYGKYLVIFGREV